MLWSFILGVFLPSYRACHIWLVPVAVVLGAIEYSMLANDGYMADATPLQYVGLVGVALADAGPMYLGHMTRRYLFRRWKERASQ